MPTFTRSAIVGVVLLGFALLGAHTASQATAPALVSNRVPQFENDAVNTWRSTILPNQPLTLHRHDHPRVLVALSDGTLNFVDFKGATQSLMLRAGNAYYLPAMPPGAMHSDVNPGSQPIQVMMIELKHEK